MNSNDSVAKETNEMTSWMMMMRTKLLVYGRIVDIAKHCYVKGDGNDEKETMRKRPVASAGQNAADVHLRARSRRRQVHHHLHGISAMTSMARGVDVALTRVPTEKFIRR
jgi:hypothetical protein